MLGDGSSGLGLNCLSVRSSLSVRASLGRSVVSEETHSQLKPHVMCVNAVRAILGARMRQHSIRKVPERAHSVDKMHSHIHKSWHMSESYSGIPESSLSGSRRMSLRKAGRPPAGFSVRMVHMVCFLGLLLHTHIHATRGGRL